MGRRIAHALTLNNNRQTTTSLNTSVQPDVQHELVRASTRSRSCAASGSTRRGSSSQVTRINRDISDVQLQASITNTLSNVRNAYWDYVFAVAGGRGGAASRSTSPASWCRTTRRASRSAPWRRSTSCRRSPSRPRARQALVHGASDAAHHRARAEAPDRRRHAGSELECDASTRPTGPTSAPSRSTSRRPSAARSASAPISTIAQEEHRVERRHLKFLRDQMLPQADLSRATGSSGLRRHAVHRRHGHRREPRSSPARFPAAIADALQHAVQQRTTRRWNVTMNFSYPLGAEHAGGVGRARARAAEPGAGADEADRAAGRDRRHQRGASRPRTPPKRVQAAQAAREFAQKKLEAEQSKFEVGMSTNYFVVQAQRDLARRAEQRAAGDPQLPQGARRARAPAADDAAEPEHHGDQRRRRRRSATRRASRQVHGGGGGQSMTKRAIVDPARRRRRRRGAYYCGGGAAQGRGGRCGAPMPAAGGRRGAGGGGGGSAAAASAGSGGGGPRLPMTVELASVKRADMAEQITVVGNLIGAATVEAVPKVAGRLEIGLRAARRSRQPRPADREDRGPRDCSSRSSRPRRRSRCRRPPSGSAKPISGSPRRNLDRSRNLFDRQLIPQQTYDDAEARYQAAAAQLDLAKAQHAAGAGAARRAEDQPGQHGDHVAGERVHRQADARSRRVGHAELGVPLGGRHQRRPAGRQRRREGPAAHFRGPARRRRGRRVPRRAVRGPRRARRAGARSRHAHGAD